MLWHLSHSGLNNEWAHVSITYNAARKRELRSEQNIWVMSTCKTLIIVAMDMMYTEWQLAHKHHLLGHAQHVYSGALLKIPFDTTLIYHFEVRYIWRTSHVLSTLYILNLMVSNSCSYNLTKWDGHQYLQKFKALIHTFISCDVSLMQNLVMIIVYTLYCIRFNVVCIVIFVKCM